MRRKHVYTVRATLPTHSHISATLPAAVVRSWGLECACHGLPDKVGSRLHLQRSSGHIWMPGWHCQPHLLAGQTCEGHGVLGAKGELRHRLALEGLHLLWEEHARGAACREGTADGLAERIEAAFAFAWCCTDAGETRSPNQAELLRSACRDSRKVGRTDGSSRKLSTSVSGSQTK